MVITEEDIGDAITVLSNEIHDNAKEKGFWDEPVSVDRFLLRICGEVAELDEALRDGNPPSAKAAGYSCAEEEAADIVIRTLDLCRGMGWDVAGAVAAKMDHNKGRPRLHGRKT